MTAWRRMCTVGAICGLLLVAVACSGAGSTAKNPAYPTHSIKLIYPFTAGGPGDITARLYAKYASQQWHQSVVVEDLPGASGVTGASQALHSAPDGYTLLINSQATDAALFASLTDLPFKRSERTYVSELAVQDDYFVVNADSPFKTLKDVMNFAKQNPSKFSWAGGAAGSAPMYTILELLHSAGVDIPKTRAVTFEGGLAPATQAVATGEVMFGVGINPTVTSLQAAGKVRILAAAATKRSPFMNVPSSTELGYHVDLEQYQGLAGPAKLPDYVVKDWEALIKKASKDPKFIADAKKQELAVSSLRSQSQMGPYVQQQYNALVPLAQEAGIRH